MRCRVKQRAPREFLLPHACLHRTHLFRNQWRQWIDRSIDCWTDGFGGIHEWSAWHGMARCDMIRYDTIRYGTILLGVCGTLVVVLTQFCLLFCTRSFPPTLVHRPTRHIHTYIHTYTMHRNRQPNDAQQHEPEAAVVAEADPREPETTFCNSTRTIRPVYRSDPPPS